MPLAFAPGLTSDLAVCSPALTWEARSRAQALHAAFEAHDAALYAGLMPDEATTLSLVVAELGTTVAAQAQGGTLAVTFLADGWRLEAAQGQGGLPPGARAGDLRLGARGLAAVTVHALPGGGSQVVAEYHRRQEPTWLVG